MKNCFTAENTSGFTAQQLSQMNREARLVKENFDPDTLEGKSEADFVAEQILAQHPRSRHPKATAEQVLTHYRAQGYEVRYAKSGRVIYRKDGGWLEGRWVSEYRIIDGSVVLP